MKVYENGVEIPYQADVECLADDKGRSPYELKKCPIGNNVCDMDCENCIQ